jgi:SAM-dependent methyltransferase
VSFDVAAAAYDAFMGRYSALLSPQLADLARVREGQRVLDVGCGTGALTAELAGRVGASRVAAVDPSASFVAATAAKLPGVDVRHASAEALPFPGDTFDAALAQLVVHFLADPVAGLREMARVTSPGGTIAACVWDHAGGKGPLATFWAAARELDPGIDDESHLPGVREGHLVELFEAAGLGDVTPATLLARRDHRSFDEWWEPFTRGVGPAGAYVRTLDDAHREALRAACRRRLPAGTFAVTGVAWAARGVVPGPQG